MDVSINLFTIFVAQGFPFSGGKNNNMVENVLVDRKYLHTITIKVF